MVPPGAKLGGREGSFEHVRTGVVGLLRARRPQLEEAIFARVRAVAPDRGDGEDAEYMAGLRGAVAAVLDYGLAGIEWGEEHCEPIPSAAVAQAQRAARAGVSLETVLLRYTAGHALLGDFLLEAAENGDLLGRGSGLRQLLRVQAALLERLTRSIAEEYQLELERVRRSPEQRRAELVRRLLAGAPVDTAGLGYDFAARHVGAIAVGVGAARAVRGLQARLHCGLLSVARGERSVWAWFGGRADLEMSDFERALSAGGERPGNACGEAREPFAGVSFALGEPGWGLEGWRATHRQAQEALRVALRRPRRLTRFADVALLAPWLEDPARARSLLDIYLSPLDGSRDDGGVLRETLRACFAAAHNVNATAAALGVDRSTVRRRLCAIEQALGCALHTRQAELEVAMRLEELQRVAAARQLS